MHATRGIIRDAAAAAGESDQDPDRGRDRNPNQSRDPDQGALRQDLQGADDNLEQIGINKISVFFAGTQMTIWNKSNFKCILPRDTGGACKLICQSIQMRK